LLIERGRGLGIVTYISFGSYAVETFNLQPENVETYTARGEA
jgi:hypothetical protein